MTGPLTVEKVAADGRAITWPEVVRTVDRFRRVGGAYEAIAARLLADHAHLEPDDDVRASGWTR